MAAETKHSCEICGLEGVRDDELRKHVLQHVGCAISCPFCDLSDVSSDEMIVHVNTTHLEYLTPNSETFSFIDEDEDDDEDDEGTYNVSPVAVTKVNGLTSGRRQLAEDLMSNNNNNQVELAASCSKTRCEGSPLRSQLNLNLRTRTNVIKPPGQKCPLCAHTSESPGQLEEHINRIHFDPVSPSFQPANNGLHSKEDYRCPFCIQTFRDSPDLELHVNLEHKDILSPTNCDVAGAAGTDDWSVQCPVCCRSNFRSNKNMLTHIESHFTNGLSPSSEVTPDSSADRLLAREMERRERETRKAQEQREFEMLRAQYGMDNQGNFKQQSLANMQKAVYAGEMSVSDYYERQVELRVAEHSGIDDGSSCTKGLLPKIRAISSSTLNVFPTYLCTTVDHYASTYGDKGWGCGYRNVQMMVSSLVHHTGYNEQLYKAGVVGRCGAVPSISRLQQHIEWAWRQGFDVQGAEQLDSKLHNTRKWIGATEVVTAFSSLRIRCQMIDFHQCTTVDGSHPELFNWALQYFQRQLDFIPPLYLQHQGHSRTIVGIEAHKEGNLSLLLFDPSHSPQQMGQLKCTSGSVAGMRLVRKTCASMKARQYQLVAVTGIMATEQEYQESKILRSIRVPAER